MKISGRISEQKKQECPYRHPCFFKIQIILNSVIIVIGTELQIIKINAAGRRRI